MNYEDHIKAMQAGNRHIRADYDSRTHRLKMYLTVPPGINWTQFQQESEVLRRHATMKQSTVIPTLWTIDPSAPQMDTLPATALCYRPDLGSCLPMLNISIVRKLQFENARADAVSAAGEATLHLQKYGKLPTAKEINYSGIIFAAEGHGDQAVHVSNLLNRINAR